MIMRLVMVLALLVILTGCLKKTADENASMEPNVTEDVVVDVVQEPHASQGKSVSVEPAASQTLAVEKPSVQDIQQALANSNLYEGKIDGILGPNTRKAIEAFQSQNGLKVDGKVGPKTWQKLKEHLIK